LVSQIDSNENVIHHVGPVSFQEVWLCFIQSQSRDWPLFYIVNSFEEGWPRRSSQMQRYLKLGAAGEVKQLLQQRSDLPRCAPFKVARHLFKGRSVPSSKEGNRPLSHILPFIHTFFAPPSPRGISRTSCAQRPVRIEGVCFRVGMSRGAAGTNLRDHSFIA